MSEDSGRVPSYLMVIPREPDDISEPDRVIDRLERALEGDGQVELEELSFDEEEGCPTLRLRYRGETYETAFFPQSFQATGMYRLCHAIPEEDLELLEETRPGLTVRMTFGQDAQAGLHLQLKLAMAMVPEALAVVDFSRETILSPVWAGMAAETLADPGPDYLFSLQAVAEEEGPVWIHTHGLNRCGLVELEALNVPRESCQMVGEAVAGLARQGVDRGELPAEDQPTLLAQLSGGDALVVSWRRWERCLEEYPADVLGGRNDRDEGHRRPSGILSHYVTPQDLQQGRRSPLGEMDGERYQNPIYMLTTRETERMSALAGERLEWLGRGLQRPRAHAIVKVGLDVDEDRQNEAGDGREHIWFELKELRADGFTGVLTQEPYFVSGLHTGAVLELGYDRLTDWILYLDGGRIVPDDAYLLTTD